MIIQIGIVERSLSESRQRMTISNYLNINTKLATDLPVVVQPTIV